MSPIAGHGVDLARIERFRRFLAEGKTGVIDRIFTEGEKAYALARKDPAPFLAVRFAAKEAFLKALGLGLRDGLSWQDMEVVKDELGCPSLHLSGRAAEIFRERSLLAVHLSYSHEGQYGMASVILEGA
ncbi:MAG: holo-[acyl-carrier-protein] synthase [Desulfuromonas sp.]|uniref:holo-ACP synthase n=1 Tax=Desulfuromonas sp. TaxID=892 RepID=UPI000CC96545|nr:holo-ACP synthase [Desulfuromonas sp.]PLX83618.1 MAG: holo-[acyl-carrier-protein] synthase [Desulfuromonas sp.]